MFNRLIAILVATSIVVATTSPAYADEATNPEVRFARTATLISYGITAASLVASGIFLAQANSARDERLAIARGTGTDDSSVWECRTPADCSRMAGLRQDHEAAAERFNAALGIAGGTFLVGTTLLVLSILEARKDRPAPAAWTRVVPAVGTQSAGVQLVGSF